MGRAVLVETYAQLGPKGKIVLLSVAERLRIGMERYGDFTDKKNMDNEAREELLDCIVYLTRGITK